MLSLSKDYSRIKYNSKSNQAVVIIDGIRQKKLGSRNESNAVNANFNSDGNLNANWNLNPQNHNVNIGGRFEEVACFKFALVIYVTLQAFYPFLGGIVPAVNIFYYQGLEYLWQV